MVTPFGAVSMKLKDFQDDKKGDENEEVSKLIGQSDGEAADPARPILDSKVE